MVDGPLQMLVFVNGNCFTLFVVVSPFIFDEMKKRKGKALLLQMVKHKATIDVDLSSGSRRPSSRATSGSVKVQ